MRTHESNHLIAMVRRLHASLSKEPLNISSSDLYTEIIRCLVGTQSNKQNCILAGCDESRYEKPNDPRQERWSRMVMASWLGSLPLVEKIAEEGGHKGGGEAGEGDNEQAREDDHDFEDHDEDDEDSPDCLNQRSYYLRTPLRAAAYRGNHDVVKWFLDNGVADQHYVVEALRAACLKGKENVVRLFLERFTHLAVHEHNYLDCFDRAAAGNNVEILRLLFEYEETARPGGKILATIFLSALREATRWNCVDAANYLLTKNTGVTMSMSAEKSQCLHFAASYGRIEIAKLLVSHGTDVNMIDRTWRRNSTVVKGVLLLAIAGNYVDLVNILLDAGASLDAVDGVSPISLAIEQSYAEMARTLLRRGADSNGRECRKVLPEVFMENRTELVKVVATAGWKRLKDNQRWIMASIILDQAWIEDRREIALFLEWLGVPELDARSKRLSRVLFKKELCQCDGSDEGFDDTCKRLCVWLSCVPTPRSERSRPQAQLMAESVTDSSEAGEKATYTHKQFEQPEEHSEQPDEPDQLPPKSATASMTDYVKTGSSSTNARAEESGLTRPMVKSNPTSHIQGSPGARRDFRMRPRRRDRND